MEWLLENTEGEGLVNSENNQLQSFSQKNNTSIYKTLDGFTSLGNDFFAVEGEKNHIVYNTLKGAPFQVDKGVFNRLLTQTYTQEDRDSLLEMGYDVEIISSNSREEYITEIQDYIDNYKGPKILDLSVSEMCNLNCHMCIHSYVRQKENPRSEKKIMNFESAQLWIDYYIEHMMNNFPEESLSFHFGAAEPLLNEKVLSKCLEYIQQKVPEGKNVDVSVNTNLTLLNDKETEMFCKYSPRINIGLDGNKEQNDKIRIDRHNKGTFDKIIENIKILKKNGLNVGVSLTLTDRNFNDVNPQEFVSLVKELKLEGMLVDIDFIQGVKNDPKVIVEKLIEFQRAGDENDIEIVGNRKAPFLNLTSEKGDEIIAFCHAAKGKNLVVTPSGKLTFCTYTSKILVDDSIEDKNTQFNAFMENMKEYMYEKNLHDMCLECVIEGLCNGGCHVTQEQKVAVEYMCKIYRESAKELLKYYFGNDSMDSVENIS